MSHSAIAVWDATYFATIEQKDTIHKWLKMYCKKYTFQLENGTECDPDADEVSQHFQLRFALIKKVRGTTLFKLFTENDIDGIHARPTSTNAMNGNWSYVMKGKPVAGPWTDEDDAEEEEKKKVEEEIPSWVKDGYKPRPFQDEIETMFENYSKLTRDEKHKNRTIHWLMNVSGNIGKGVLVKRLQYRKLATKVPPMETEKIMGFLCSKRTHYIGYIFDLPKAQTDKAMKSFANSLESIKEGYFYDWRNKAKERYIDPPMVWVFSNLKPPVKFLSMDRWVIWHVDQAGRLQPGYDENTETVRSEKELEEELKERMKAVKRKREEDTIAGRAFI